MIIMRKKILSALLSSLFFFPSISFADDCLELKQVERKNDFIPEGYQNYWNSKKICGYYTNPINGKKFYVEMFDIDEDGETDVSERRNMNGNIIDLFPDTYIFPNYGTLLDIFAKQPNGLNGDEFRIWIPKEKFPYYKKIIKK